MNAGRTGSSEIVYLEVTDLRLHKRTLKCRPLPLRPEMPTNPPTHTPDHSALLGSRIRHWVASEWPPLDSKRTHARCATFKAEKINESYLCRMLRRLSPAITEAVLNGLQPDGLELAQLLRSIPAKWDQQQTLFSSDARKAEQR